MQGFLLCAANLGITIKFLIYKHTVRRWPGVDSKQVIASIFGSTLAALQLAKHRGLVDFAEDNLDHFLSYIGRNCFGY